MGVTSRPTTTFDIVRAIGALDDMVGRLTDQQAIDAGGQVLADRDDLKHCRRVICGLRDQVKEAVTMAMVHLTPRLFWRDGERWLEHGLVPPAAPAEDVRMLDYAPNLERLWLDTHPADVEAAALFGRTFPGRKIRF